jgi:hypothetical protein
MCTVVSNDAVARAVAAPEDVRLGAALELLFTSGRIEYRGIIRLARQRGDYDLGWRRLSVERLGEALAVLVLEDAAGLHLSTLKRQPEERNRLNPDFRANGRGSRKLLIGV